MLQASEQQGTRGKGGGGTRETPSSSESASLQRCEGGRGGVSPQQVVHIVMMLNIHSLCIHREIELNKVVDIEKGAVEAVTSYRCGADRHLNRLKILKYIYE